MVQRIRLASLLLCVASVAASGCGHFEVRQAQSLVDQVGAERIRQAAQSLRKFSETPNQNVPPESWPKVLGELQPESISVDKGGVTISKYSFFVAAEVL